MRLKSRHRYQYTDPQGRTFPVMFLAGKGKGWAKVVSYGPGPAYLTVARHRLTELPTIPKQQELFS